MLFQSRFPGRDIDAMGRITDSGGETEAGINLWIEVLNAFIKEVFDLVEVALL